MSTPLPPGAGGLPPTRQNMPSSFDDEEGFANDDRIGKLWRLMKQDPLIILGCGLTVWAFMRASKAMKKNDHSTANKMFRRRIYAQAFTIVAIVVGSSFMSKDKETRKRDIEAEKARREREKKEKWLAELDFRDAEDREAHAEMQRRIRERVQGGGSASVLEECERTFVRRGGVLEAVRRLGWPRGEGGEEGRG